MKIYMCVYVFIDINCYVFIYIYQMYMNFILLFNLFIKEFQKIDICEWIENKMIVVRKQVDQENYCKFN